MWFPQQVYFLVARSMIITARLNLPSDRGSKRICSVQICLFYVGKLNRPSLGCTTRCTQLPPSFPTNPQQCHEVLFWNSFRQTCPSSVKQTIVCLTDEGHVFLKLFQNKTSWHCCGFVGNEGGSWVHRVVHPSLTKLSFNLPSARKIILDRVHSKNSYNLWSRVVLGSRSDNGVRQCMRVNSEC